MRKLLIILGVVIVFGTATLLLRNSNYSGVSDRRDFEHDKVDDIFSAERVGPLKITMFFDFGNPDCLDAFAVTKKLEDKFGDKILVDRRHFPLETRYRPIHEAAECARNQGKFDGFLTNYFENQFGFYDDDTIREVALMTELNMNEFRMCLESDKAARNRVSQDKAMGKRKYNVTETPFFVFDRSVKISDLLPEEVLLTLVEKMLD
ncbi:hypothetical protein K9M41_01945 [Candidatus Gracilibacteria bacterium]|nr:hypothetical protein [Candidatus Gracilibacteria bacterium]